MTNFNWNDAVVIEFAKATTKGAYGNYKGCKTVESKLERFKLIDRAKDEFNMLLNDDPDFNYEDYEFDEWFFDVYISLENPY